MKYLPDNTLRYFDSMPYVRKFDMSHFSLSSVATSCDRYLKNCVTSSPEAHAVQFYTLNHLVSVVKKHFTPYEVLPNWAIDVARKYNSILLDQSYRMFYYMLLIVTRESRHLKSMDSEWWGNFKSKYGNQCWSFNKLIKGCNSQEAVSHFIGSWPVTNLVNYVASLVHIFNEGKFHGGYGGKPWGNIAQALLNYVSGVYSLEMLVDTAYTLAHNNGPIFNKGMMYDSYTHTIFKILDVQRSGQMPEAVMTDAFGGMSAYSSMKTYADMTKIAFPDEFGEYVDWFKVEKMGALHKYDQEKKLQLAKYGEKKLTQEGKVVVGDYRLYPGVSLVQFKRVA